MNTCFQTSCYCGNEINGQTDSKKKPVFCLHVLPVFFSASNPLRQEAQVQATLLINNGKIQVGPKAKVCDISNYDPIKCLGSFYSIVRPMMMTNP